MPHTTSLALCILGQCLICNANRKAVLPDAFLDVDRMGDFQNLSSVPKSNSSEPMWARHKCKACVGVVDYVWLLESTTLPHLCVAFICTLAPVLMIGLVVSSRLVPSLLNVSTSLQVHPAIAAIVILSAGSGVPDMLEYCMAFSSKDMTLAIGEMLGGNMFCLCINGAMTLVMIAYRKVNTVGHSHRNLLASLSSPLVEVVGHLEALGTWIVALSVLACIIFHIGLVSTSQALALPLLYIAFLGILMFRRSSNKQRSQSTEPNQPIDSAILSDTQDHADTGGLLEKLLWAVCLPLDVAIWVSVPSGDGKWDCSRRIAAALHPIGMLLLSLALSVVRTSFMSMSLAGQVLALFLALALGFALFFGSTDGPDLPKFHNLLVILSIVSSIMWLAVCARELTAIAEAIAFLGTMSRMVVGCGPIAWANCLGDLLAGAEFALKGQNDIALLIIFCGPLFDDLVGFAGAMVRYSKAGVLLGQSWSKPVHLELQVCFICLAFASMVHVFVLVFRGQYPHFWVAMLLTVYAMFILVTSCLAERME